MEIERFTDKNHRTVEIHINMGREVFIYQKYPELQDGSLDSSIAFLPLSALKDILNFCEECQQTPQMTVNGAKITERSMTFSCGDMQVTACFDLQKFVSIKNRFVDMDGTTFRSQISHLLLTSLEKAVAFGKKCEQEFLAMLAKAREADPTIANSPASQSKIQTL